LSERVRRTMLFLIDYDRMKGEIVTLKSFFKRESLAAEDTRLEMELAYIRDGIEHEVVLLEAETELALRRTHRRYFEDLKELVEVP
jgi:hypothetical protein